MWLAGAVTKETECQWAVDPAAQLNQQEGLLESAGMEPVVVGVRNAFDEAVDPQFPQIIAELKQRIVRGLDRELIE